MRLVFKHLFRQMKKQTIFLSLLSLLTALTSLSFFFVLSSVDSNWSALQALDWLTEDQQRYQRALSSNMTLAYSSWLSFMGLSAFVYVLFFYRFFRAGKKQLGCMKALGYEDSTLQGFFLLSTAVLSLSGSLAGALGGYLLSDILLQANARTYGMTGLTKGVSLPHLLTGLMVPAAVFCGMSIFSYHIFFSGRAGGRSVSALSAELLLKKPATGAFSGCFSRYASTQTPRLLVRPVLQRSFGLSRYAGMPMSCPLSLRIADKLSRRAWVPQDKRLSLRIALRRPLSILLIFTAAMTFNVCLFLGRSLNISSAKVFHSQMDGHHYHCEINYPDYRTAAVPEDAMIYLRHPAVFQLGEHAPERTLTGLFYVNGLYGLKNREDALLAVPAPGTVYISPELSQLYGVKIHDPLTVRIGSRAHTFTVADIAVNAQTGTIYVNGPQLAELLDLEEDSYNGVLTDVLLSDAPLSDVLLPGGSVTSREQRVQALERDAVSNKTSAWIDQAAGVTAGAILLFLALYLNLQDHLHDLQILQMMGYTAKEARKLLVDVYGPVLWTAFMVTIVPGIALARAIQNTLSISTDDYMPFGVDGYAIVAAFLSICLIERCAHLVAVREPMKSWQPSEGL